MSTVTTAGRVGEKCDESSTSCGPELHSCHVTDSARSSLLLFDDVDFQTICCCGDVGVVSGADHGSREGIKAKIHYTSFPVASP